MISQLPLTTLRHIRIPLFFGLQIIDYLLFDQVFYDGIEALQVSYKKLNPFCVPFSTSNMGAAMLAIDLVSYLLDEIKI